MGPGDLHMSYGIKRDASEPLDSRITEARQRVFEACKKNGIAFLEVAEPEVFPDLGIWHPLAPNMFEDIWNTIH